MSSLTNSNKRARHDSITSEGDEDMLNDLSNASQTADFKWLKKPEKKHILRIMDDEYPCLAIIKSPCNRQSTSFSAISIQKLDEDTVYSTSFVSCDLCDAIFVGNGGHLKRHRDKSCPVTGTNGGVVANGSSTQSSSQSSSKSDFDDALIEYFAKTAKPLYSLETKPLRELLVRFAQLGQNFSGDINDNIVLKRGAARSMVDAKLTEKTNDIYKLLQPFFERKSVSVLADFGKLNFDFLSIKCGYLETIKDDNGIDRWALVIAPVAMAAVNLESKDGESVYKSILESLETCHQNADAKDCYIVADGGSNVRSAGKKYFGGYIRCAAHASEIIGKRMLNPYKKEKTTAEDKRVLAKYTDLMEKCKKLTQTLKADKFRYRDLGVSLVEPVPTRWMSGYICTFQVCDNISKLKDHIRNLSQKSRDLIMEISGAEYRALFDEMNPIYKSIAECNEYFQKNSTNISEVILAYVGLLDDVEEIKERFQSSKNQKVLLKFADKAIKKQLNDLVGAHYVSYYLNPTYKSLEDLQAKFDHHLVACTTCNFATIAIELLGAAVDTSVIDQGTDATGCKKITFRASRTDTNFCVALDLTATIPSGPIDIKDGTEADITAYTDLTCAADGTYSHNGVFV
ncbi:unnamed protein product [Caenorhabditis brenneri]